MASQRKSDRPVGVCIAVLAGMALAFTGCGQDEPGAANPAANNQIDGISLTIEATSSAARRGAVGPTLYLTVWNASPCKRKLAGLRVSQDNLHYRNNSLLWARDLTYVFRFADGEAVSVRHTYPRALPAACGMDGMDVRYGPLELPAGDRLRQKVGWVEVDLALGSRQTAGPCPSFALTTVVDTMGLRSNTLFFNGEFALSAGYDPIAEGLGYRAGPGAKMEREYQEHMAIVDRNAARRAGPP